MSIVEQHGFDLSSQAKGDTATIVDHMVWGARLRDAELRVANILTVCVLHCVSATLVVFALLQWVGTPLIFSPELALVKLLLSGLLIAGSVIVTYYARRNRTTMVEIDTQSRMMRTVLESDPQTVIEHLDFDEIADVYVAPHEGRYVLALARKGVKQAEIIAHGPLGGMQSLQQMIQRGLV